jgi:uncharacterized repeat protein (TIGR03803 family)
MRAHRRSLSTLSRIASFAAIIVALTFLATAHAQTATESVVYSFCAQPANLGCNDGNYPSGGIIQAADGNFYGTTQSGGTNQDGGDGGIGGTVFQLSGSTLTTLNSFCSGLTSDCAGGYFLPAGLIQAGNGKFYGETNSGGTGKAGTIFSISSAGALDTLYNLCTQPGSGVPCLDGGNPYGGLIEGSDGNFYGSASADGDFDYGIAFQMSSSGSYNIFHTFCNSSLFLCADGTQPITGLIEASDGNYYGTTWQDGANSGGTVYKITPAGKFTVVYNFCSQANCADGTEPSTLVEGSDGNLYGVTYGGGANSQGSIFKVTTAGVLTTIHSFCAKANCPDGQNPGSQLWVGSDGNFYGSAPGGGNASYSAGVVFKITPSGTYTVLYTFCNLGTYCYDGEGPMGPLVQSSTGSLYGTTGLGGAHLFSNGSGTVYEVALSPALAAPVQLTLSSSSVKPNTAITLSWKVLNAFSTTMQQCYAFVAGTGAGKWTGKQTGTYSLSTKLYTGSASITPTVAGTYTYALTCGGRETGFAKLTVASAKTDSTTALTASPNPLSVGQSITLKAAVKGSGSTPTGSVSYSVSTVVLGSANLNGSGVASLTATTNGQAPGSYPVVATYAGNSSYNGSASPAIIVTLNKAPTSTTLTASPTTVTPPASVTLTATVKRTASSATGTPTGTVTFSVNGVTLATSKLNGSGVATLSASSQGQSPGSYPVIATYNGDANDGGSSSSSVTVKVQ